MCGFISSYPFLWWFILFCWENDKSFRCPSIESHFDNIRKIAKHFSFEALKDKCGQCQFPMIMNCDLYPLFLCLYPYIALGRFISQRCFRFLLRLRQIIQMRSLLEISLSYQHSLENLQRLGWPMSFQQNLVEVIVWRTYQFLRSTVQSIRFSFPVLHEFLEIWSISVHSFVFPRSVLPGCTTHLFSFMLYLLLICLSYWFILSLLQLLCPFSFQQKKLLCPFSPKPFTML